MRHYAAARVGVRPTKGERRRYCVPSDISRREKEIKREGRG